MGAGRGRDPWKNPRKNKLQYETNDAYGQSVEMPKAQPATRARDMSNVDPSEDSAWDGASTTTYDCPTAPLPHCLAAPLHPR